MDQYGPYASLLQKTSQHHNELMNISKNIRDKNSFPSDSQSIFLQPAFRIQWIDAQIQEMIKNFGYCGDLYTSEKTTFEPWRDCRGHNRTKAYALANIKKIK